MRTYNYIFLFYTIVFICLGVLLIAFCLHVFELNTLVSLLNEYYTNLHSRISLTATGIAMVLLALLFAQIVSAKQEREKTIAFTNPSGQVTITLLAVEDLIRRISQDFPQIKELRPNVIIRKKKGIDVNIRLILKSEVNIPEFTAHLQETIKSKIQEIFGIEEAIMVKIYVAKILSQHEKTKEKNKDSSSYDKDKEINIPYQTFRNL